MPPCHPRPARTPTLGFGLPRMYHEPGALTIRLPRPHRPRSARRRFPVCGRDVAERVRPAMVRPALAAVGRCCGGHRHSSTEPPQGRTENPSRSVTVPTFHIVISWAKLWDVRSQSFATPDRRGADWTNEMEAWFTCATVRSTHSNAIRRAGHGRPAPHDGSSTPTRNLRLTRGGDCEG